MRKWKSWIVNRTRTQRMGNLFFLLPLWKIYILQWWAFIRLLTQIYLQRKIHTEKWRMEIYRLNFRVIVSAAHLICMHLMIRNEKYPMQIYSKRWYCISMYILSPLANLVKFLKRRFQTIHCMLRWHWWWWCTHCKNAFSQRRERNCRLSHHYHSLSTRRRYKCYINYLWLFACAKRERTRLVFEND